MATTIRHWQKEVPTGEWRCEDCPYKTADLQEAANHSETNQKWVYLFEPGNRIPTFEMHPSDSMSGGVYLNEV